MCSIVFCANASSASPISRRRSSVAARTASGSCTTPRATTFVPLQDVAAAHDDVVAVAEAVEDLVVGEVDEVDAGLDEQQRAHVRVGARRRGAAVQHGEHARGDEVLGGDAIEVLVVEHGDGPGAKLLDEALGPATQPRRPSELSASGDGHRASLFVRVNGFRRAGARAGRAARLRRGGGGC